MHHNAGLANLEKLPSMLSIWKTWFFNAQLALCNFHFLAEKCKEVDTDYQNYLLNRNYEHGDKSAKIEIVYKTAQNGVVHVVNLHLILLLLRDHLVITFRNL